jgi:single-stranded-DNA-specific exonuclease
VLIERRTPCCGEHRLPDGLPPLLERIYLNRGIDSGEQLDLALGKLLRTEALGGMQTATALLWQAIEEERRILVVGDFDADGATSSALAIRALRAMGARDIHYLVPNRFDFGYGLTAPLVEVARELDPWLIITVDNGISSTEGVATARELGIQVLVTDHHLPPEELPAAHAIVNPNLQDDAFPSKALAGVGVIFYVMAALRSRLRELGWFQSRGIAEPNLAEYLDLVALGTVADVVPLDHNNRILVQNGLQRIRSGRCCAGIRALLEVSGRDLETVTSSDLGFFAGPRLNAAGRLEDMSVGIECLLTDDPQVARELAMQLDSLNRQRREIESTMKEQALAALEPLQLASETLPAGICLFDDSWHQGVVGIVASRVKERYHRPVIVFAAENDDMLKGSARSIQGVHIRDLLDAIATEHPGLIRKFGGHAMAAGLSLPRAGLAEFRTLFDRYVRMQVDEQQLRGCMLSDGPLAKEELTIDQARLLRDAGPWGQGFPEPLFDDRFLVLSQRIVGGNHLKLQLAPEKFPELRLEAIAFNQAEEHQLVTGQLLQAVYRLDINAWKGRESLQLILQAIIEQQP